MNRGRRNWLDDECRVFLKSWKDHVHYFRFLKKFSNKNPLLSAICNDLQKHGYKRSLSEIMYKMKNVRRRKQLVCGTSGFKWSKEVEKIRKMEETERDQKQASEPQLEQASELLYDLYVEENIPKSVEVVTTSFPNDENYSNSDLLSHTATQHAEPEALNNTQMSLPKLSGSHSKKSTETILLNICREFRSSNRQLEENDIGILELFKEQNDIFRKQTKIMMKLLENY